MLLMKGDECTTLVTWLVSLVKHHSVDSHTYLLNISLSLSLTHTHTHTINYTEPYPKALQFFQTHSSSSSSSSSITSLDFSDLQLTTDISQPIFKALSSSNSGSHHQLHSLTSVILKGNQLGDAAMIDLTSSLSRVSTLSELNLSKTGITAQVRCHGSTMYMYIYAGACGTV